MAGQKLLWISDVLQLRDERMWSDNQLCDDKVCLPREDEEEVYWGKIFFKKVNAGIRAYLASAN